jgi:hypothetical protein
VSLYRTDEYEEPLTEIMKLFIGNEPLLKIFIELLPEKFIERKYVSRSPEFNAFSPNWKTLWS